MDMIENKCSLVKIHIKIEDQLQTKPDMIICKMMIGNY